MIQVYNQLIRNVKIFFLIFEWQCGQILRAHPQNTSC